MIQTVPFDIILSFIIGCAVALWFKQELQAGVRPWLNPYFGAALAFECFFYLPLGLWLYYFHTAWSWMYFFDPASLKPATLAVLGVAAVSCYLLALVFGFQLTQLLVANKREKMAMAITGLAMLSLLLFCSFTLNRLLYVADYHSWKLGMGVFLPQHRLSYLNTVMALLGFGSLALLLLKLKGRSISPPA